MIQKIFIFCRNCLERCVPAYLLAAILAGSCKLDSQDSVFIDNKLDINFINSSNEDLLDTAVLGGFSADSIHLFNLEDGIPEEVNNRQPFPHNFYIFKNEQFQKYVLRVFLEVETTYLQLNRHITDTIVCAINRSEGNFIISKVWYNGTVKWDDYAASREITVVVK